MTNMNNQSFFYMTSFLAFVVVAGLVYALIQLKKKNPGRGLGDTINHIFLHDLNTFVALGLVGANVFEAIMAASIPSVAGEVNIQPVARFGSHLFISFVGIAFGLASIACLVKIKHVKENKGEVIAMAVICLIAAAIIPFINVFLIAQGLGQIPPFLYVVRFKWLEGFSHMTYPMATSTAMWWLHYVLLVADAFLALKMGTGFLKSFTSGSNIKASSIDKLITDKGDEEQKQKDSHPDNIIRRILKMYRFKDPHNYETVVKDSITKKDALQPGPLARLGNKLVELEKSITKLSGSKANNGEVERTAINTKIYQKIWDFWKNSHVTGDGFGVELPEKKNLKSKNWMGQVPKRFARM